MTDEQLAQKRAYHREWQARWRAENPDRAKKTAQRFREKNREKIRNVSRTRYYSDLDKNRAYYRGVQAAKYKFIADIKVAAGCVDCGFNAHADALQFDHLPQYEKKFNIGPAIRSKSKQSVLDEINKCEVRCANCHAIKTAQRRSNG